MIGRKARGDGAARIACGGELKVRKTEIARCAAFADAVRPRSSSSRARRRRRAASTVPATSHDHGDGRGPHSHPHHDEFDHDHSDHDHAHRHDHAHDHSHIHGAHAAGVSVERIVRIERDILSKNNVYARPTGCGLAAPALSPLNFVSSPDRAKRPCSVVPSWISQGPLPVAVIEGDQQTSIDADRIRADGRQRSR